MQMKLVIFFQTMLGNRSFRSLWSAQVVSQIAMNISTFVLAVRMFEVSHSNTAVGLLMLFSALPAIPLAPLAGVYADRLDRKLLLLTTTTFRAFLFFLFSYVDHSVSSLIVFSFILSTVNLFFGPAEAATIPSIVSHEYLFAANSMYMFTMFSTVLTGYMIAGPLLGVLGNENIFLLLGFLLLFASFFIGKMPSVGNGRQPASELFATELSDIFRELLAGLKYLVEHRATTLLPVLQITLTQALLSMLLVIAPGFAIDILHIDIKASSYLLIGPGGVGFVVSLIWMNLYARHMSAARLIVGGILLAGATLLLLTFFHTLLFSMIFLFFLGLASPLIAIPAQTQLQRNLSEEFRGRVYGILIMSVSVAALLPVAITGFLADVFGIVEVVFFVSILTLLFGLYNFQHHNGFVRLVPFVENGVQRLSAYVSRRFPMNGKDSDS